MAQLHPNSLKGRKVFVVIPAYACAHTIGSVIASLPAFIDTVVVVDDASPDDLKAVVGKVMKANNKVILLSHAVNQGVGGATMTGYEYAIHHRADLIIKMDADGQMDANYLTALLTPLLKEQADYVKGNRYLYLHSINKMPLGRRVGNFAYSILAKMASGYWNIFDFSNGFTAVKTDVIKLVDLAKVHKRFFFETSLLIELGLEKALVRDVYIPPIYGNEKSNLSELDSFLRFPFLLLKGTLRRVFIQYFVRDFNASTVFLILGSLFTLFGLIFGLDHWMISIQTGLPATTGTVIVAFLPFFLGIQLLLQFLILDVNGFPTRPRILED
jgi:dolichol-phosphate mannosyltransferase